MGVLRFHRGLEDPEGHPRTYRIFTGQYVNPGRVRGLSKKERRRAREQARRGQA
jgi:hypothetical protein